MYQTYKYREAGLGDRVEKKLDLELVSQIQVLVSHFLWSKILNLYNSLCIYFGSSLLPQTLPITKFLEDLTSESSAIYPHPMPLTKQLLKNTPWLNAAKGGARIGRSRGCQRHISPTWQVESPGEAMPCVTCTHLGATTGCCHHLGMPDMLGKNASVERQTTLDQFFSGPQYV